MRKKTYNKLVRDNIPEIIRKSGDEAKTRVLRVGEYKKALLDKLAEEVAEVGKAKDKTELINELADVQEVMTAIYDAYGIKCDDVTTSALEKRNKMGGFKKKIFLISTK